MPAAQWHGVSWLTPPQKLNRELMAYHQDISKYNPFKQNLNIMDQFTKSRDEIIASWPRRNPDDQNSRNMNWVTFAAILRREGSIFKASYGVTYHWIETLIVPLMELIYPDWDRVFDHEILKMEYPMSKTIRAVWNSYIGEMREYFANHVGSRQLALAADELIVGISNIQDELCFRSRSCIKELRDEALGAKEILMDTVNAHMRPIFLKCLTFSE
jgi:hypothetical protein